MKIKTKTKSKLKPKIDPKIRRKLKREKYAHIAGSYQNIWEKLQTKNGKISESI
ncbi:MAG: hypothetical protein ACFE68_09535 [Candidatus Hodarchaeota archaeon]